MRGKVRVAQLGGFAAVAAVGVAVDLVYVDEAAARASPVAAVGIGARSPTLSVQPTVARLGWRASITVTGVEAGSLEARLAGATRAGGERLPWQPLSFRDGAWRGTLHPPALRGVYPVQLRVGRGEQVWQSPRWLFRVYARGTVSRPAFATPEGVARWWARSVAGGVLRASKRWPRPDFDRRNRRLHQLIVIAYSPRGSLAVADRLGMFVTAVRETFDGRWRLLETNVYP
jgi:hypothetical protein